MSTQESLTVSQTPHQEGHIKAVKYKWMKIEMVQCQRAYNGHSKAKVVKLWQMALIAFPLQKEVQLSLFHAKRMAGFLLAPEVDTQGSPVPQKLCYNNAPAVPGAPFSTAHWRYLSCWIRLGQNIQKVPHHATPHQLGRIKPLTLGISSWNWIERFRRNFMSLRSFFA